MPAPTSILEAKTEPDDDLASERDDGEKANADLRMYWQALDMAGYSPSHGVAGNAAVVSQNSPRPKRATPVSSYEG